MRLSVRCSLQMRIRVIRWSARAWASALKHVSCLMASKAIIGRARDSQPEITKGCFQEQFKEGESRSRPDPPRAALAL